MWCFFLWSRKIQCSAFLAIMHMNRTLDPVTYVCKTSHDRMQPKDMKQHGTGQRVHGNMLERPLQYLSGSDERTLGRLTCIILLLIMLHE